MLFWFLIRVVIHSYFVIPLPNQCFHWRWWWPSRSKTKFYNQFNCILRDAVYIYMYRIHHFVVVNSTFKAKARSVGSTAAKHLSVISPRWIVSIMLDCVSVFCYQKNGLFYVNRYQNLYVCVCMYCKFSSTPDI